MVMLSYFRRLCTWPVSAWPVALASVLALAVPNPAAGSTLLGTPAGKASVSAVPPAALAAPRDTDWSDDTLNVDHSRISRGGYVVNEDQLDREQDYSLSSILVAHIPGIRVVRGPQFDRVVSGIHVSIAGDPCYVQMFIDGVFVGDGDVDMVSVRDLSSIEYRTPGNIPVQYQNRLQGAACGALFLWSKT
jgi:hypothetical protein